MRRVRIIQEAAEEAIEAAAWYEKEHPGLGIEFNHAINAALDLLEQDIIPLANLPGIMGISEAKRLVFRRFPFDIVVRESAEEIVVIAIAHHSRQPGYWRGR
ncbi:MAG: hypothetical protein E6Q62_09220 [Nitrosomonas sp.]|nr:MAG: hypothetical protein E6Q62_09220 [Nitrosomonas sp.]